jgi:hypothetical protein
MVNCDFGDVASDGMKEPRVIKSTGMTGSSTRLTAGVGVFIGVTGSCRLVAIFETLAGVARDFGEVIETSLEVTDAAYVFGTCKAFTGTRTGREKRFRTTT